VRTAKRAGYVLSVPSTSAYADDATWYACAVPAQAIAG